MAESEGNPRGDCVATVRMTTSRSDGNTQTAIEHKTPEAGRKNRKLLREITKLQPITRCKSKRRNKTGSPKGKITTVDTSRAKSSCDVVRLAIRD